MLSWFSVVYSGFFGFPTYSPLIFVKLMGLEDEMSFWECHFQGLPPPPPKFLKSYLPKRKLVFQPYIFRCYVSFSEGYFSFWKCSHVMVTFLYVWSPEFPEKNHKDLQVGKPMVNVVGTFFSLDVVFPIRSM